MAPCEDTVNSPPKPWSTGKQETYTAFRLVVNICQDEYGNVWSDHECLSSDDELVMHQLPQGGVPQVAHALLTEATRREVFTSALVLMSRDPQFLAQWVAADSTGRRVLEQELEEAAKTVLARTVEKMLPGAVAGILTMLASQRSATE